MGVQEWTVKEVSTRSMSKSIADRIQAYYPSKCSLGEGPYYTPERHELRYMVSKYPIGWRVEYIV